MMDILNTGRQTFEEKCLRPLHVNILCINHYTSYIYPRKNYEEIEAQKTQFMIAVERQRVVEKGFLSPRPEKQKALRTLDPEKAQGLRSKPQELIPFRTMKDV
jgi:hypothetical protein